MHLIALLIKMNTHVGERPRKATVPPPPRAEPKWYQNDRMGLLYQIPDVHKKKVGINFA